ncbi:hypothetical protein ACSBPU_05545 [Parapusillimonas sp. JC17]|uniref:hypothetical protein n=1 Tax=Parapusillimonas sp. JC17 TaxID=3445768 RepID=UPI003FA0AF52
MQKYTSLQKVALGVVAICAVFIVGLVVAFGDDHQAREQQKDAAEKIERNCTDKVMAFTMSRNFVKKALAAPSTVDFPSFTDDGVSASQTGRCKFRVSAYVDAQNSFGAMLRTRYTIDMEYLPDSNAWHGSNLKM